MSANPKAEPFYNTTIMYFTIVTLITFAGIYTYDNFYKKQINNNN